MKKAFRALKAGNIVGIFPEGTRNGMKKGVKFHSGAALIALKTGTKGSFKAFRKVKLNYGKPMDFSKYADKKSDREVLDEITKEIMDEVVRLTNEKI